MKATIEQIINKHCQSLTASKRDIIADSDRDGMWDTECYEIDRAILELHKVKSKLTSCN